MNAGSVFALLIFTLEVAIHVEVQNVKLTSLLIIEVTVLVQA